MTIMTVAEDGPTVDSVAGHQTAVRRWAETVWRVWQPQRHHVVALTQRLQPDLATSR